MKQFTKDLQVAYKTEYKMKPYKGLAIYPKILEKKKASEFSPEEKKHLTRKGFRWYVYFSYLNDQDKYEKVPPITLKINKEYPDFDNRYVAIHRIFEKTKQLLEDGRTPWEVSIVDGELFTIEKAIDYALSNKKLKVSVDTYKDYAMRAGQLKAFLKKKGVLDRSTQAFNQKIIRDFLKEIARNSSMSNRNNVLRVVKALFSEMYKNDLIQENYVAKIEIEKVKSERFKSYSQSQAEEILGYLEKEHPYLALFIKFIGYNFLRPVEVARLTAGDINLEEKTLSVFVKQGKYKTKRIPGDIVEELSKYDLSKKKQLIFASDRIIGKWDKSASTRRQTISKRFTRILRSLGYDEGYVMYSFRHTYVTIAYKNLRKRLSKDDALDTLMGYTGHDTRDALQKYIHYIDAEIVGEYKGVVE